MVAQWLYVRYLVQDLAHTAYTQAWQIGKERATPEASRIWVEMADLDRDGNQDLASAVSTIASALETLARLLAVPSTGYTLRRQMLRMVMRFAGETLDEPTVDRMLQEMEDDGRSPGLAE